MAFHPLFRFLYHRVYRDSDGGDLPLCIEQSGGWFYTGECGGYRRSGSFKSGDLLFRNCGGMHIDIGILLSYPLVLALRRLNLGKRGFALFVLILPMWMNFILRVLAWQMILSNNGILNLLLQKIGLEPVALANSGVAIMIGVVYDYLPYMVLPIFNAVSEIDEDIIDAAKDLGAGGFTIFRKIIFPLSVPGLLSGIVMVFVPSMTSFVISDILGGGKLQLIGNIIEQEFTKSMNWYLGSGLSVSLMIFVLISMAFTMRNDMEGKGSAIW